LLCKSQWNELEYVKSRQSVYEEEKERLAVAVLKHWESKAGKNDREADKVAFVRLLMFLSIFITNLFHY
jgi:hypothetical protein